MTLEALGYAAASITTIGFLYGIVRAIVNSYKKVVDRINELESSLEINQRFFVNCDCKAVTESGKLIDIESGTKFVLKNSMKESNVVKGFVFHDEVTIYIDQEHLTSE